MSKRVVYQGDDGIAKVVVPSPSFLASGRPLSDLKGRPKDGRTEMEVDESEIDSDRTFRNSWELDETKSSGRPTKVNMDKAKPIAQERVRQARKPKLEKMDADWFRAQEQGDSTKANEVANKKQTLRDATEDTRITGAATPEELKAAMEAIEEEIASME